MTASPTFPPSPTPRRRRYVLRERARRTDHSSAASTVATSSGRSITPGSCVRAIACRLETTKHGTPLMPVRTKILGVHRIALVVACQKATHRRRLQSARIRHSDQHRCIADIETVGEVGRE